MVDVVDKRHVVAAFDMPVGCKLLAHCYTFVTGYILLLLLLVDDDCSLDDNFVRLNRLAVGRKLVVVRSLVAVVGSMLAVDCNQLGHSLVVLHIDMT